MQERQSENPERLAALGAGDGSADVEYEQFLKAKEADSSRVARVKLRGRGEMEREEKESGRVCGGGYLSHA